MFCFLRLATTRNMPWRGGHRILACRGIVLAHLGRRTHFPTRGEGPQGIRKSTALRTVAGEYFADELADLGSKDAATQTRGVWIIELSELDNLSHAEVARVKAFMSRTTDRFRLPYGMRLVESSRQCFFADTPFHCHSRNTGANFQNGLAIRRWFG